jgi:hypothetical protein
MLILGEWRACDDGVTRPAVRAKVQDADGAYLVEIFLIDCCADCTVFSDTLRNRLRFPATAQPQPTGLGLQGIGGVIGFALVNTVLEFTRDDGGPAHVRGAFAAFTDPAATDLSSLGRDVLNHFDLILSRRRDEVLLLAPNHRYRIEGV